jgi:hypothetical protein
MVLYYVHILWIVGNCANFYIFSNKASKESAETNRDYADLRVLLVFIKYGSSDNDFCVDLF